MRLKLPRHVGRQDGVLEHGEVVAEIPNAALTDDAPCTSVTRAVEPRSIAKCGAYTLGDSADLRPSSSACLGAEHLFEALGVAAV